MNLLREFLATVGIDLTPEMEERFEEFQTKLYEVNQVMNLTRISQDDCEVRHFIDSLLFVDLFPQGAKVLDIGFGAGFPSWPLACARPDLTVVGIDAHQKSVSFLSSVPLPNLGLECGRAEDMRVTEAFDVVTGRAVAPLSAQLEISARPCKIGGHILPLRGPSDIFEIDRLGQPFECEALGLALSETVQRQLYGSDATRVLPIFKKVTKTQPGFPRPWGIIKKKPV